MSALDRVLGRVPTNHGEIESVNVNPLMQMIGKMIPPQLVEQLGAQVSGVVQHFKDQQDILIRQNTVIISKQKAIMAKLGIEHDGCDNNSNGGTDSAL